MRFQPLKRAGHIAVGLILAIFLSHEAKAQTDELAPWSVKYRGKATEVTDDQRTAVSNALSDVDGHVRELLTDLPDSVIVYVDFIDRDIEVVGGVTGRTLRHKIRGEIVVEISTVYPSGISGAIDDALRSVLYHEYHHLSRGWSIHENVFGAGIPFAAVNEGLAVVFSEIQTGLSMEANQYPADVDAWVREILTLDRTANYMEWVSGFHPDGRSYIGYRAGKYIVEQALKQSGLSIIDLSSLPVDEIVELAGY